VYGAKVYAKLFVDYLVGLATFHYSAELSRIFVCRE